MITAAELSKAVLSIAIEFDSMVTYSKLSQFAKVFSPIVATPSETITSFTVELPLKVFTIIETFLPELRLAGIVTVVSSPA